MLKPFQLDIVCSSDGDFTIDHTPAPESNHVRRSSHVRHTWESPTGTFIDRRGLHPLLVEAMLERMGEEWVAE